MYLQDYQLLGGIFVPRQVLKCDEKHGIVVMRGSLLLNDKDFHITISAKRERLTKIIRVAGETMEIAKDNKRELNMIRAHGIHMNVGGLRTFVSRRVLRNAAWYLLMLLYLICFLVCGIHIAKHGITTVSVVGIIICMAMTVFGVKNKSLLVMERRGLKVYYGED